MARVALTLGLVGWLVTSAAVAQPLSSAQTKEMSAEISTARAAFKAKDYAVALTHLRAALPFAARIGNLDQGIVRRNMARCEEALGHPKRAVAGYRDYLVLAEREPSQADRLNEARTRIERLQSTAALAVECGGVPSRVTVHSAERLPQACPALFTEMSPGDLTLTVRSHHGPQLQAVRQLIAGERLEVALTLPAQLVVTGAPVGSKLFVDAARRTLDSEAIDVSAIQHVVRVEAEGFEIWEQPVFPKPGQRLDVAVELREPIDNSTSAWVWVGIGAGVLALGGLTFFLLQEDESGLAQEQLQVNFESLAPRW